MCSQFKKGCFWHRSDDVKYNILWLNFLKELACDWFEFTETFRGKNLKLPSTHKRIFSVFLVKLWSTDMEHSVACLEAKANVCCVKFNPESRYHLSFGSAGRQVYLSTGVTLEGTTINI